jgi:hypothetical protein
VALVLRSDKGAKGHDAEAFTPGVRDELLNESFADSGSPEAFVNGSVIGNDFRRRYA